MGKSLKRLKGAFLKHRKAKWQWKIVLATLLLSATTSVGTPSLLLLGRLSPGIIHAEAPENAPENPADEPGFIEHTVSAGQTLRRLAMSYGTTVSDILKSNEMRPEDAIHPGQKLKVPDSGTVQASWYGSWFNGRLMANQKPYHVTKLVIAHRYLPLGTCVELTNPKNGKSATGIVQDRINVSYAHRRDLSL